MSYEKYESCPLCKGAIKKEHYVKSIYLYSCTICGWPYMSKMMKYYESINRKHVLDFFYSFYEYVDGRHGMKVPRASNGNILLQMIPHMMGWNSKDPVRGAMLYAVLNVSKDGRFYEFRGVYSNPYFAQNECDRIDDENERRNVKAKAHYESIPLNHPCGTSMYLKMFEGNRKNEE